MQFLQSGDEYVDELLGDENKLYKIYNYQRFYVWDTQKVETYINDILLTSTRLRTDQNAMHYYGQFIILEREHDRRNRVTYEVIDGQQRMTTFLLLTAAMYGEAVGIELEHPETKDEVQLFLSECKKFLCSKKQNAEVQAKLELSSKDNSYFFEILTALCGQKTVLSKRKLQSHKRLCEAQMYIVNKLKDLLQQENTATANLQILSDILRVATEKFQIIVLKLTDERYTYQLYQVVNDRGEPLTDSELLRAKSIELLATNDGWCTEAKEIWDDILSDSGKDTDLYLKWCYMSKIGKDKGEDRYYKDYLHSYFEIKDACELTEAQQKAFINNLRLLYEDIKVCRKLAKGEWPYESDSDTEAWKKSTLTTLIVNRKHTLSIPVLLSAYRQKSKSGKPDVSNFFQCVQLCENFFVLIKGVFSQSEVRLKKRYLDAAKQMRESANYRSKSFQQDLCEIDGKSVQEECLQKLKDLTYKSNADNKLLKHLCILYEVYFRCVQDPKQLHMNAVPDGTNVVYSEISLEHIYPETAKDADVADEMEAVKHRLGNLVLYGRKDNSALKNKTYPMKREQYKSSGFVSVSEVADTYTDWSIEEFQKRHDAVCSKLSRLLLRYY